MVIKCSFGHAGSEVFVGRLPRKVDVSKLIGTVGKIGPIYKIRLMMNFSGTNRGYCFVQYTSAESAERAIKELNRLEIAKGKRIFAIEQQVISKKCVMKLKLF